ncbi:MAG: pal [Rickettsiaceae bacterium]|jgi:peptidoglycan-associated lipoprotein|nr:pal [Rickettsiaceae bacterium]
MFSKRLAIMSLVLVITGCSSMSGSKSTGVNGGTSSVEDRYRIESGNLETFSPISGSKVGARANDRVFFEYDSSALSANGQATLDKQSAYLKKNSKANVSVEGHCDERGTREYNLALGERRASAVKSYLVKSGIAANRISTISYGKERPAVVGSSDSEWAENRRGVTVLK